MRPESPDVIALLGSRICHDLISPISAIGNGVELLMMSGAVPGPELALISESVTNANARIRFFRIAFGAAGPGQKIAQREVRSILDDMTRGGRLRYAWTPEGDAEREEVKLAFLALQCLETALPYGGRVRVSAAEGHWRIAAETTGTKIDPALWDSLRGEKTEVDSLAPAHLQFLLFPAELARQDRHLTLSTGETAITLDY